MVTYTPFNSLVSNGLPQLDFFLQTASFTAMKYHPEKGYFYQNLERGLLLYSLVACRGCSNVLEFGTGRGYSALCMAKALLDTQREGDVATIDIVPTSAPQLAATCEGDTPTRKECTVADLLDRCDSELQRKLHLLCGDSQVVARDLAAKGRRFDLIYIDGNHRYLGALFDLVSALKLLESPGTIVFDDYALPGVWRLVNELDEKLSDAIIAVRTDGMVPELSFGNHHPSDKQAMVIVSITDRDEVLSMLGWPRKLQYPYFWLSSVRTALANCRRKGRRKIGFWATRG